MDDQRPAVDPGIRENEDWGDINLRKALWYGIAGMTGGAILAALSGCDWIMLIVTGCACGSMGAAIGLRANELSESAVTMAGVRILISILMVSSSLIIFFYFIPLRGGICGPYNNPFGMNDSLQTMIWLSSLPLFLIGIIAPFFRSIKKFLEVEITECEKEQAENNSQS